MAADIHVKNCNIYAFVALRQLEGSSDIASWANDLTTEVQKHIFKQKAYHHFVLNEENVKAF